jgi:hypothetical protein
MDAFTEDWNASQFWYSDETATLLAKRLLDGATSESAVAVVSAPSVFIQMKNILSSGAVSVKPEIVLLEYDQRFSVFKEFVFYDFASPTRLPGEYSSSWILVMKVALTLPRTIERSLR